ncbi:hypothetical protein Sango_1721300 [Sesamum angolense]|uniref:Reverse transcriptase RNase H-like domain-containing protein n=1 Tax=Sesamum angolense TaxID=2727404 RepID=A0AAE1WLV7_9LAMI|nr:hypothetical protein Sango_1721300 [Sesamum angolense]
MKRAMKRIERVMTRNKIDEPAVKGFMYIMKGEVELVEKNTISPSGVDLEVSAYRGLDPNSTFSQVGPKREEHLADLQIVFDRLRKYNLKMNPLKCAFGVTTRKFLDSIIRHRGIEVDLSKIDTIQNMPHLRNLKDLRSLQGGVVGQENEGKEKALYYLGRTLTENELKYPPVEKVCLALFYAIKKLRHYFELYCIRFISHVNPVKFVMSRSILSGRLAKWSIVFNQYEIEYVPQKAVK